MLTPGSSPQISPTDLGYHVLPGDLLLEALRRVENGEKADLVYAELWANAEHEEIAADG